jgi:site-specific DNA-cytosine methylase
MTQTEGTTMNVLSLFDGMSCGQIALDNLGIKVDNYFSSEIDKYAMQVAKKNYPNTQHIGDVTKVKAEDLPKIDLIIGGSPCQSFSSAGNGKGFDESSGLFYEWVRLLKECKPKYFFLENVVMKKEWEQVITDELGVEPVLINSKQFTAQSRPRLYWTNIHFEAPTCDGEKLIDILENMDFDREPYIENYVSNRAVIYTKEKFNTLRASAGSKTRGIGVCNEEGWWRKLLPTECERLQGVPRNYTDVVSNSQRYKMLGNGWTVPVIEHILSGLKN